MAPRDPESQPRYLALVQLLRTAETIWSASRVYFERWHLSPSQFNVLNLLRVYPDGLSQTDLSRYLVMHRSNVTGLVDHLEDRGLAARRDVAADRRAYSVALTPAGSKLLAEILPGYYEGVIRIWGDLPDRRVSRLAADLARVAATVERVAAEPYPTKSSRIKTRGTATRRPRTRQPIGRRNETR